MEKINYNIFHFDKLTKSYPYTIEDCAVSFILYLNKIPFVCDKYFVKLYEKRTDDENYIASHTNKYRNLSLKSLDKNLIDKVIISNDNEKDIVKFFNESIKKCKKQELSIIFNKKSDKILNNFNILFSMIPDNFDILCTFSVLYRSKRYLLSFTPTTIPLNGCMRIAPR